jgi:hypothetical protein
LRIAFLKNCEKLFFQIVGKMGAFFKTHNFKG